MDVSVARISTLTSLLLETALRYVAMSYVINTIITLINIIILHNITQIGKITKQWSGIGREIFTDSDNFGVNFPIDLDVKVFNIFYTKQSLIYL